MDWYEDLFNELPDPPQSTYPEGVAWPHTHEGMETR